MLARDVATNVLKDKDQRPAFMSDVHAAIRLSEEPNFVNIYDAASERVTAYCVGQHIGGQTLRARLWAAGVRRGGPSAGDRGAAAPGEAGGVLAAGQAAGADVS